MNNFNLNLKYLTIAVVIISALMIGGALIFSQVAFKTQKLPTPSAQPQSQIQSPTPNVNPVAGSSGEAGQQPGVVQKPVTPELIK